MTTIAGVDEAGRGPLAGPLTVAAVILDPARPIPGLNDSKQLSEKRREALYPQIIEHALAWRIEFITAAEIDALNILQATLTGIRRALIALFAKVARDRHMRALHLEYPHYGFDRHKGYPTAAHKQALIKHGPCPEHRRSYAPVQQSLRLAR